MRVALADLPWQLNVLQHLKSWLGCCVIWRVF